MGFFDFLNHLLNWVAPAAWLAVFMTLVPRVFKQNRYAKPSLRVALALNFTVAFAALLLGLVVFGRDGKTATYAGMVVLCASSEWLLLRGWSKAKKPA